MGLFSKDIKTMDDLLLHGNLALAGEFSSGGAARRASPAGVHVSARAPFAPASPGRYNLDPLGT